MNKNTNKTATDEDLYLITILSQTKGECEIRYCCHDVGCALSLCTPSQVDHIRDITKKADSKPSQPSEGEWEKIENDLGIFLWGKKNEADAMKLAKQTMPFIKEIIASQKKEMVGEIMKTVFLDDEVSYKKFGKEWEALYKGWVLAKDKVIKLLTEKGGV